jgi:hypothetical protein
MSALPFAFSAAILFSFLVSNIYGLILHSLKILYSMKSTVTRTPGVQVRLIL